MGDLSPVIAAHLPLRRPGPIHQSQPAYSATTASSNGSLGISPPPPRTLPLPLIQDPLTEVPVPFDPSANNTTHNGSSSNNSNGNSNTKRRRSAPYPVNTSAAATTTNRQEPTMNPLLGSPGSADDEHDSTERKKHRSGSGGAQQVLTSGSHRVQMQSCRALTAA